MSSVHEAEVVNETSDVEPVKGRKNGKKPGAIAKRDAGALEVQATVQRITIEDMIMKALDMDKPELIDKFVAIYEKQEDERKKTAYTAAMSRAQSKMVPVANNAINTFTNSRYAKLAAINKMAMPIYGAEGLSVSFKTGKAEKQDEHRTIAIVSHEAGYMSTDDDFFVDLPLDEAGSAGKTNKTKLHAKKSTGTYAKNMLVCMIFNISTADDVDDDGNGGAGVSYEQVSETQVADIVALADETKKKGETAKLVIEKLCKFYHIDKIENLPASKYQSAVAEFERKRSRA